MVAAISARAVDGFFMRGARVVVRKVQHREAGLGRSPAQGLEDFLLVAEVVVDERLGYAQRLHDLLDGGAGIAIAIEQGFGGLENALALLVGAGRGQALTATRRHGGSRLSGGLSGWGGHEGLRVSHSLYQWVALLGHLQWC